MTYRRIVLSISESSPFHRDFLTADMGKTVGGKPETHFHVDASANGFVYVGNIHVQSIRLVDDGLEAVVLLLDPPPAADEEGG